MNSVNSVNSIDATKQEKMQQYRNRLISILKNEIKADPFNVSLLLNKTKYNDEERNNILRHLLYYTYSATASEIENHKEINKYLSEIKTLLEEHVNKDKKTDAPASP